MFLVEKSLAGSELAPKMPWAVKKVGFSLGSFLVNLYF